MITTPPSGGPLPGSWINAVTDSINGDTPTTFTTTTPAGTGWYRYLLGEALVQVHWESTGTVAATTSVGPDFTFPAGYRPAARTALTAVQVTTTRTASAVIAADGSFAVYNGDSSARAMIVDGIFAAA